MRILFQRELRGILLFLLLMIVSTGFTQSLHRPIRTFGEGQIPKVGDPKGIIQDGRGVIWVWGSRGATWYDGARFGHLSTETGLPSDHVYHVKTLPDNSILFATYGGLVQYHPGLGTLDTLLSDPGIPIRDVVVHEKGLFIATNAGVMFHDERGYFRIGVMPADTTFGFNFLVHQFAYDPERELLWAATDRIGVVRIDLTELWPLLETNPEVVSDLVVHQCPIAFRYEKPHMVDPLEFYTISEAQARTRRWQKVAQLYTIHPRHIPWAVEGLVLDPEHGGVLLHTRQEVYRISEAGSIERVGVPRQPVGVRRLALLKDGRVSIVRSDGVFMLEGKETDPSAREWITRQSNIRAHYQDQQGIHWMVDSRGDLHRYSSIGISVFASQSYPILEDLREIHELENGTLLLASSRGLAHLFRDSLETIFRFDQLLGGFAASGVDRYGQYMIATSNRLYRFNPATRRAAALTGELIVNSSRTNFDADDQGNLWFVLSEHLYRWDGDHLARHEKDSFTASLFLDAEPGGRILVGQWPWLYERNDGIVRRYTALAILEAEHEEFPNSGWVEERPFVSLPSNKLNDDFSAMVGATGPDGAYWVGTFNSGIVRIVSFANPYQTIDSMRVYDKRTGLPSNSVHQLNVGSNGDLHFTLAHGAAVITREGIQSVTVPLPEGAILFDFLCLDDGRIICATSHGLLIISEDRSFALDKSSGLPEDAVVRVRLLADGSLLAQQPNGVFLVDLEHLLGSVQPGGAPVFSSVVVNETRFDPQERVVVESQRRSLRCEIALPDFFNERSHLFSWRLAGFDADFRPYSHQTQIEYTNLPPGEYRLELKARNGFGEERIVEKPLILFVPRRFHETPLFYLTMIVLGLLVILLFLRWRIARLRAQQEAALHVEQEKLLVASRLAAAVAHEFNNPLQIILGAWELNRNKGLPQEKKTEYLDRIPTQVSRMQVLIEKLLAIRQIREVDYAAGVKILDLATQSLEEGTPVAEPEDPDAKKPDTNPEM